MLFLNPATPVCDSNCFKKTVNIWNDGILALVLLRFSSPSPGPVAFLKRARGAEPCKGRDRAREGTNECQRRWNVMDTYLL